MGVMGNLYISSDDYQYIVAAIKKADFKEIGGLGVVEITEDGSGIVRHNRLLEQKISTSEVEWSDDAHAEYLEWLYTQTNWDKNEYGIYSWHSHGSMQVFFSNTDDDFIEKIGKSVPWVFSSVFNKKLEQNHRLDVFRGVNAICPLVDEQTHIVYKDCALNVIPYADEVPLLDSLEELVSGYDETIEALVKERDEKAKDIKAEIKKKSEANIKSVTAQMEADYKEYVSSSYAVTTGAAINQWQKGWVSKEDTGPLELTTGVNPKSSESASAKNNAGSPAGDFDNDAWLTDGTSDAHDYKVYDRMERVGLDFREELYVRVYDGNFDIENITDLKDAINDDVVILSDLPEIVLEKLSDEERHKIAAKPSFEDAFSSYLGYYSWS